MTGWEGWSTVNSARDCNLDVQPNGQWYMTHLRYLIEWKTPNPLGLKPIAQSRPDVRSFSGRKRDVRSRISMSDPTIQ